MTEFLKTRTGGFPIGFRRGWSDWQRDLPAVLRWAKENRFGVVDLGNDADKLLPDLAKAGLQAGSVDLPAWKELISPDAAQRRKGVEQAATYIQACAKAAGPLNYFVVMLPEKPGLGRAENFAFMVESYRALAPVLEEAGGKIVIEGWPGPGALCCTPETLRAFFRDVPSPAMGINFDPSHLIRMNIDPIRFLREFAGRVFHVHGKDTERFPENVYECGSEQPPAFLKGHGFGGATWRYTIPGHGETRWTEAFRILEGAGYRGAVSIELEDENFNGTEAGEKLALALGRDYLAGC